MNTFLLLLALGAYQSPGKLDLLIKEITQSGRVLSLIPKLEEPVRLSPGAPPLLAFRYLEGRERGRFGGLDLVLDDAGH